MSYRLNDLYEFGPFVLDPHERTLVRDGQPVSLTGKAFDVLLFLVRNPARLVEKDEILTAVWAGTFVEENNLANQVSRIRKALSDSESGLRYIETVPTRGYRFVATVRSGALEPVAATVPLPLPSGRRRRRVAVAAGLLMLAMALGATHLLRNRPAGGPQSIVVIPFTAEAEIEYLADGITESLINNLSLIHDLRVTPRTTAFGYKGSPADPRQIGRTVDAATVLTGRVGLRDDMLVVQVEMVDTATGAQKWGERYQRKLADIFAVEEDIGRQITRALRIELSGEQRRQLARRRTDDAEAYQLYLQGLYLFSRKTEADLRKSTEYFQRAVTRDPEYALAWTGLANSYVTLSAQQEPATLLPKARRAATRALEIDPELAEAHASLGFIKWIHDLDDAGAERELVRAIELDPHLADAHFRYARVLADTGRFAEARAEAAKAVELEPLSIQYRKSVAYILLVSRRYDEAVVEYTKLMDVAPDFTQIHRELGLTYEQKGMYGEALTHLQRALEMPGSYFRTMVRADIAHLHAVSGRHDDARRLLDELIEMAQREYVSAYDVAVVYASLEETDRAFAWLERAIEQRPFWLVWLRLDPRLDGLRKDERFASVLRRATRVPRGPVSPTAAQAPKASR